MALVTDASASEFLETAIHRAIKEAVAEEVEKAAYAAAEEARAAVRGRLGTITTRILSHYSIERNGQTLIIRVEAP